MEKEVQQLVEMGATAAQARAALEQYKDVMQAAEQIFDGKFDHIVDDEVDGDGDVQMGSSERAAPPPKVRMITPHEDEDDDEDAIGEDEDEDGSVEDFADYDSDDDAHIPVSSSVPSVDPYAGIFFSKDRREEVIEVEEEPQVVLVPEANIEVPLMTQGQWMKGCPEGSEQSFLFSLYQELSEGECNCPNGCGTSIKRKKSDFFSLFPDFQSYIKHVQELVLRNCTRCLKAFCFACGEPANIDQNRDTSNPEQDLALFHCPNLQGVILGVGLAMLEKVFIDETTRDVPLDKAKKPRTSSKRRKVELSVLLGGGSKHYDDDDDSDGHHSLIASKKKAKLGVGYAGDVREDNTGQLEAQAVQREKDDKLAELLKQIGGFLPSLHRPGGGRTSDYLVHPTTLAHLRRRFNFVGSQLLRNDSLADMSERSVLYFELLEWLETISCHEALASMMAMPIMVVASVKSLSPKKGSPRGSPAIRERTIIYEGSSGPRELLEAIVIQAHAAVKGLESAKPAEVPPEEMTEEQKRMTNDDKGKARAFDAGSSEENAKLLTFCKRILSTAKAIDRSLAESKGEAFVERLHAGLPQIPRSAKDADAVKVDAGDTEESAMKAYLEWANRVRFEYCDLTIARPDRDTKDEDTLPHYKFYYSNEARMLANSDIPKRSLAIAKELAVLTTNLPVAWNSSVFLRVDETRVDVIKALITGPEGTPYYNGCFLFDIFLGPSYNTSPPNVKYMTTGGGKFRFNPNLYADGKVCLSLLGTWSGPGWIPGKSTLLQVLISIQSMILCEEPYLNEPGWASGAGTAESRAYSANIRRMVVKIAMLGMLKNPPEPFEDVIRTHFRLKARSIIAQVDKWLTEDDGKPTLPDGANLPKTAGGSNNGFQTDVTELKTLLHQLQSGEGAGSS
ncbi:ubiquitin conjugating enzyme family protein [Obba rivulosa]|uniref:Ubiquitin conjugating enzyme family protein n=1 Tax=Obba rivulosa TaxID=1052685 RepID=A0A8E2DRL7_9APHY|nr:ubiquitin conjugating enzyme family protein [Obba rivulosa]